MSEQRKVTIGLVSYTDADGVPQTATLGETVELGPKDVARLERLLAVGPVDDDVLVVETVAAPLPPVSPDEAGRLLLDAPAEKPARRSAAPKD